LTSAQDDPELGLPSADLARRMDFVRQVHTNVAENIRLADTKAGLIAAGAAALLNVLASRARAEILFVATSFDTQPLLVASRLGVLLLAVGASAVALLFAYLALRPRLHGKRSYIAFPELARMSPDLYLQHIESQSDNELIAELARDTINLARIAVIKNAMIIRSLPPLVGAAVGVAILLLLG
jgi:hypothetical protein